MTTVDEHVLLLQVKFGIGPKGSLMRALNMAASDKKQLMAAMEADIDGQRHENAGLRQDLDGLTARVNGLILENSNLRQSVSALTSRVDIFVEENAGLRQQSNAMRHDVDGQRLLIDALNGQVDALTQTNATQELVLNAQAVVINGMTAQINGQGAVINGLTAQLNGQGAVINGLTAQLNGQGAVVTGLTAQLNTLSQTNASQGVVISGLTAQLNGAQQAIIGLQQSDCALRDRLAELDQLIIDGLAWHGP